MFPEFTVLCGGRPRNETFSTVAEQNQYVFEAMTIGSAKTFRSMDIGPPSDEAVVSLFPAFEIELPQNAVVDPAIQ